MAKALSANACVVGSGPNGLTAAIVLAQAGVPVTLFEAASTLGGGLRTEELTLPGFFHDVCSAVHPMAVSSPVFASFPLSEHGLEWIHAPIPLAHPFDDGSAAILARSVGETAAGLGADRDAYRRAITPLVDHWHELAAEILEPLHFPRNPLLLARFGFRALWPASVCARIVFRTNRARALFAGLAAHSVLPLEAFGSAAFSWILAAAAHAVGWPIPRGGSGRFAGALVSYLKSFNGPVVTGARIASIRQIQEFAPVLLDITPRQLLKIARSALPPWYARKLERYRYGPGAFKLDWALSDPIPWNAQECKRAGTVHLGSTFEEIAVSESDAWDGREASRPFTIVVQPSLFDIGRAPAGRHTAWAYCHVPQASGADMTGRVEAQIERFAKGFRDTILARHVLNPQGLERHNENLVGGDILGGAQTIPQLFLRPTRWMYRTPLDRVFLCSSSTPPGGGVHGMCGFHAARLALRADGIEDR